MTAPDDLDRPVMKQRRYATLAVAPAHVLPRLRIVGRRVERPAIAVDGVPGGDLARVGERPPYAHGLGPDCAGHRDRNHGPRVTFLTDSKISRGGAKRKSTPGSAAGYVLATGSVSALTIASTAARAFARISSSFAS